jgi:UDP-N-acetylmuramate--alanine ligase
MLALTLDRLGLQPGFILGGVSRDLGTNARAGGGQYFVIEADEYDYMFLGLEPSLILVTNVEYDHPDCFPTREGYQTAFARFVGRLKSGGTLVTNADQAGAASLVNAQPSETTSLTYGLSANSDVAARNLAVNQAGGMSFTLHAPYGSSSLASIDLLVPGEHNVRNALGVLAVQLALGNSLPAAVAAISTYHGSSRRFEIVGEINGITIIDDYAHHPSKIKATLAAARTRFPGRRLVAVWQPHTYSRTLALEEDFINAFTDANLVIVTGIYASREKVQEYSVENLVKRITYVQALHIESLRDVTQFLARNLQPEDVLLVLSAGDADSVCREVILLLKERKG